MLFGFCRDGVCTGAMKVCTLALSLAISLAVPVASQAQPAPRSDATETNRPPIIPFLEATDFISTQQRGGDDRARFPNALEADIFPHLVAYQNFTDLVDIDEQQKRGLGRIREFAVSISGTVIEWFTGTRERSRQIAEV